MSETKPDAVFTADAREDHLLQAYQNAFEIAAACLTTLDPALVSQNSGAAFDAARDCFLIRFLGADYRVHRAEKRITLAEDDDKTAPVTTRVLLAHYLTHAQGVALADEWISFKELPHGGAIYCSNFQKRAIDPIVKRFSQDFENFYRAAQFLDGQPVQAGHAAVELRVFPRVPVRYVIWQGDEEIPSSGTILFDASVGAYLPVEDVVVAASEGSYALIRKSKA